MNEGSIRIQLFQGPRRPTDLGGPQVLSEIVSATIALVLTRLLPALCRRQGARPGQLWIEFASLAFFAGYIVVCALSPHGEQGRWVGAAIQLWLAAVVMISLVAKRPFTLPIARARAPQQVWETPGFYAFNMKITGMWAASFFVSGIVVSALVLAHYSSTLITVIVMVLAVAVPVACTHRVVNTLQP